MFGGTFDPPHIGHAIVARDVLERLDLDRLLVVPAARPPHRDATLPPAVRLALTRRLFEGAEGIEVSDVEYQRSGPSYAVETLEAVRRQTEGADLTLVIGADQLALIDTWHDYERLPRLARIAVMRREGDEPALPDTARDLPYIAVDVTRIDLSASRIRERLRRGRPIRYLVPESIRVDIERAWHEAARAQPASR
ncbi:MAG: nicotinate (nicotinamide) nucleotide adenylyltransferase [Gemmatimonadota bacterium]|nr:nicotinate (nicotinamide) nucleotide adenylyltransferase [Gemmatimonadota bacterium]